MPWTVDDVNDHMKDLSPSEKKAWVEVANKALAACEKAERENCDASAIKQANAVIGKLREALSADEEVFVEAASFKVMLQRFMKAAGMLAEHAFISKGTRKRLSGLQDALRAEHDEAAGEASVSATEATPGGEEEFREEGVLLEVADG